MRPTQTQSVVVGHNFACSSQFDARPDWGGLFTRSEFLLEIGESRFQRPKFMGALVLGQEPSYAAIGRSATGVRCACRNRAIRRFCLSPQTLSGQETVFQAVTRTLRPNPTLRHRGALRYNGETSVILCSKVFLPFSATLFSYATGSC